MLLPKLPSLLTKLRPLRKTDYSEPESAPLKAVEMTGRLSGLMLSLTQRQTYINDSQDLCEFVYTFPLPYGAALMDLRVIMDGRELKGTVIERRQAEKRYEEAIDEGDAPIMVNQTADGLFTANIGNIKSGEEVVVEIRYAQLQRFEQGHLSLRLPTVIAPRYGEAHGAGGLAPHETDRVNLAADYPLTLKLEVTGEAAKARLSSPTHQINCQAAEDGLMVSLAPGARLDRDIVINFDELNGRSFVVKGPDEDLEVVLASFCPNLADPKAPATPLRLKILVDCSGSMSGDSMQGAKGALHRILNDLDTKDEISYSRFGSHAQHDLNRLSPCAPETLRALGQLIDRTEADLGGTEMEKALISAFRDIEGSEGSADLLLITDGDIWDTNNVIESARRSGHRVFAIGVGSSPAESLLRKIAEESGGACEFISPRDDFEAAVKRQMHRMRGPKAVDIEIDWGQEPLWRTEPPRCLYDGETIHVFAAFQQPLQKSPCLKWHLNGQAQTASAGEITTDGSSDLRRLGGRQRIESAEGQETLDLALRYQLVGPQSSLFLIRVREDGEKSASLPRLRQVEQMLAAGYGGLGSVMESMCFASACLGVTGSRLFKLGAPRKRLNGPAYFKPMKPVKNKKHNQIATKEATRAPKNHGPVHSDPLELLLDFDRQALVFPDFSAIVLKLEADHPVVAWNRSLDVLIKSEGLTKETAWALLLFWLADKVANERPAISRQARRLLRQALSALDDSRRKNLLAGIESCFPKFNI